RRAQLEPGVELPASIPLDSLPVLDVDKLNALTESLSLEAVRDFLQLFLADTLSHIAAITTEDRQGVMRNAHAVVSAAGNIGVMRLSAVAKLLEAACRENNVPEIPRLTGELQALARVS